MQKLESIDKQQIINESVNNTQIITESVANTTIQQSAEPVFKSSIARSLAEEFGYKISEAPVTSGTGAPVQSGSAPEGGQAASPAENPGVFGKVGNFFKQNAADYDARQKADAAARSPEGMAAAKAKLTPSQLKWLGGAEPSPEILARVPKPLPGEVPGGQAASPAAPGTGPAKTDAEAAANKAKVQANLPANMSMNDYNKARDASEPDEPADGAAASPTAPAGDAAKNPVGTTNAATAIPTGGLENPANQAKPTAAGGQAASPAAPAKKPFTPDPEGTAIAQKLKMDTNAIKFFQKNHGLTADGLIGPKTAAALKQAQAAAANGDSVAQGGGGAGRGSANDPRRTDAKPAPTGSSMPAVDTMGNATGMAESIIKQDNAILAMIRNIRV